GDGGGVDALLPALQACYPQLPEALLHGLARRHGTRTRALLGDAQTVEALGMHFGAGLYAREVDYLVEHEWATHAEDVLWRRTHSGLRLDAAQQARLATYLATPLAPAQAPATNP
uniref:glycerol-3-phosphate dehydrogenase C-terminal domain-containing protein n=1 Tax=uncultured Stenotrophomonas sp. TaxID=165438 RepID=UPI0028D2629B